MAVNACRTTLAGETGEVEVPELSLARGDAKSAVEWSASPLPVRAETVIGIDLGTTTVAAMKIRNGEVVARSGCFNSQNRFGDNVVTRINHAGTAEGVRELQAAAVADINVLLGELGCDGVSRIAVSGNTVMSLLLHGIDPTPIGIMPFTPPQRIFPVCDARKLGIECDAGLLTVPAIAGYVGGDLTSGIAEVGLKPARCSSISARTAKSSFARGRNCTPRPPPAGPAFEGAGIECGAAPRPVQSTTGLRTGAGPCSAESIRSGSAALRSSIFWRSCAKAAGSMSSAGSNRPRNRSRLRRGWRSTSGKSPSC